MTIRNPVLRALAIVTFPAWGAAWYCWHVVAALFGVLRDAYGLLAPR